MATKQYILILCICLLGIAGCKKTNPEGREDVRGTITLNGAPIEIGTIIFDPTGSDHASGGSAQIINGKYELVGIGGVKPGQYIVRISARREYDLKTGKPADENTQEGFYYFVVYTPPEFNTNSTIEFAVVQGKRNTFNYNVVTDYVPDTNPPRR